VSIIAAQHSLRPSRLGIQFELLKRNIHGLFQAKIPQNPHGYCAIYFQSNKIVSLSNTPSRIARHAVVNMHAVKAKYSYCVHLIFTTVAMHTPRLVVLIALPLLTAAALLLHGPIAQPAHYHDFADTRALWGIPHAADVLSNLPFLLIGLWGLVRAQHTSVALKNATLCLCVWLIATCFGSAFYHWAPNNFGLLIDRIPIALACAAITALLLADRVHARAGAALPLCTLSVLAIASCLLWYASEQAGASDLRLYLFVQFLPMLLVPLLTLLFAGGTVSARTWWLVVALYAIAKAVELLDHSIYTTVHLVSGHTLKHMFAAAAAYVLVRALTAPRETVRV
jgi:hypothetical protein